MLVFSWRSFAQLIRGVPVKFLLFWVLPHLVKFRQSITLLNSPNIRCLAAERFKFYNFQDYFDKLLSTRRCQGITVKQDADLGKGNFLLTSVLFQCLLSKFLMCKMYLLQGVYATKDFKEGELVLKDQMFVGAQHSSNKVTFFFFLINILVW